MLRRVPTRPDRSSRGGVSGFLIAAIVVSAGVAGFGRVQTVLASAYSSTVVADSPSDYWPADEGSGSTVNEFGVGSRNLSINNSITWFGTGLVSGSNSAVQGACSSCPPGWASGVPAPLPATRSEEIWFASPSGSSPTPQGLISVRQPDNGSGGCSEDHTEVVMEPNPNIRVDSLNCGIAEFATDCNFNQNGVPNVLDKASHLIDVVENAGVSTIYVDGILCATGSSVNAAISAPDCVALGAVECTDGHFPLTDNSVIGQGALYPYALTPTQMSNHFNAGRQSGGYLPSVNGYGFQNPGGKAVTVPPFDRMVSFYPDSRFEIEYPVFNSPTVLAKWFYRNLWQGAYTAGLCYGMATSSQFLFLNFPDKSAVALYPNFPTSPFPGALGASPSPADTNIEEFIDRYHSRQLAAAGALSSIGSWKDATLRGNRATFDVIAAAVASGQPEWVGLGPSTAVLTEGPDKKANAKRWWFLYNASHAVLAYRVDQSTNRILVYDPNAPTDDNAYIQIVDSPINPGGGILLVHSKPPGVSYGGGGDLGLPGEWTLMPLSAASFTEAGSVPFESNRKWVLDAAGPIALLLGVTIPTLGGAPIFLMSGQANGPSEAEFMPSGTGLSETITAARPGGRTSQQSGSHVVDIDQTESTAAGTTHQVSISADSSAVHLSDASSAQQYTVMLGADFLSTYGRSITVGGIPLAPAGTLDVSADQTYSSLTLATTGVGQTHGSLLLEQLGQNAGTVNLGVTIPGGGSQGVVFVGDWSALATSLVFEVLTGPSGQVTGILLQDNPGQRQQLTATLLATLRGEINQVSDASVRNSLLAKLDNASNRIAAGAPSVAANVLDALEHQVADLTGTSITPEQAASINTTNSELTGLLRSAVA